MTLGERELLIGLADEFPILRDELTRKLITDNHRRFAFDEEARDRQYDRWRTRAVAAAYRRQRWKRRIGPFLAVASALAVCRLTWLLAHHDGGSVLWAMLYGFLALFGGGMWLESNEPVRLPPTAAEIKQMARQG